MSNGEILEKYQDIIDKILGNIELNNEEKSIVENDSNFKTYQKEFNLVGKAISHSALVNKLSDVNKMEQKYKQEKPTRRLGRRSYLLLAAAAILLLLAFFLFNNKTSGSYDGDLLASNSIIPYATGYETRGSETNANIDSSYINFINLDYYKATQDLEKRIKLDNDPKHKFFLALSHLNREKWKAAEKILEQKEVRNLTDYPINFYLAIAKTGQRKTEEAIELLEASNSSGFIMHNKQGDKLLKKLKSKI